MSKDYRIVRHFGQTPEIVMILCATDLTTAIQAMAKAHDPQMHGMLGLEVADRGTVGFRPLYMDSLGTCSRCGRDVTLSASAEAWLVIERGAMVEFYHCADRADCDEAKTKRDGAGEVIASA